MTRLASKLLIATALLGGLFVAILGGLNAANADLPVAPTAVAPATPAARDADGNLVVDLKDWQETRIIIGTPSIKGRR